MKKGFTLIELLVTVSIVGLIASVALANLQSARQKAREGAGRQFHTTVRSGLGDKMVSRWELNEPDTQLGGGGIIGRPGEDDPNIFDGSGSGLNGFSYDTESVAEGIDGTSINFNGDSYIWGRNFPDPGLNGDFTVAAWIKPQDIAGDHIIFALTDGGDGTCIKPIEVGISGGKGSVNGDPTTDYILVNNVWQNLVFTFKNDPIDGPKVDTYLNGNKVGTTLGIGTGSCPNAIWSIGAVVSYDGEAIDDYDQGFNGLIDSLSVFNGSF